MCVRCVVRSAPPSQFVVSARGIIVTSVLMPTLVGNKLFISQYMMDNYLLVSSGYANFVRFATFWDFFYNFCSDVQTCHHLGGGMRILFKIREKRPFQKCMGAGRGGCSHFSIQCCTLDGTHRHALHISIRFIQNHHRHSRCLFQARLGPRNKPRPVCGQGTYFFNFYQSCSLRSFTSTHPVLRGIAHRPSVVRSTFHCSVRRTLRHGTGLLSLATRLMPLHPQPLCSPRASPFAHQRLLWCIRGSNSLWSEFI